MSWSASAAGPHGGQPVATLGPPLAAASSALVLLHGRGASAQSILTLAQELPRAGMIYVAPQAAGQTWYPQRFIAPIESNEPWLTSALTAVDEVVETILRAGIPAERLAIAGFSQGGCLALEYVMRRPRRFGAVIGFSAGLIGPPGTTWAAPQPLTGTAVFLGCSDQDSHIPATRVRESAAAFRAAGADVTAILYPGLEHTVSGEELEEARRLIDRLPLPPAAARPF